MTIYCIHDKVRLPSDSFAWKGCKRSMELITLGTGSCAVSATRFHSSILIHAEQALYLFDAGAPVEALICRAGADLKQLRAVFISHFHADHAAGLPALIRAISDVHGKVKIFLPDFSKKSALEAWLSALHLADWSKHVSLHPIQAASFLYQDELATVGAIATAHLPSVLPSLFAFTFSSNGRRILYSGDLSADLHDYPLCAKETYFDLCLLEATHFSPETALPHLRLSQFGKLLFVHVHTTWQSQQGEEALLRAYASLPYPVFISKDGARFTL